MNIYFAGASRGGREDVALYFEIIEQLKEYNQERAGVESYFR